jgi:hypothetical protein
MYACNNCGEAVAQAKGKCPGCNIRLSESTVTSLQPGASAKPDADLEVSHRCTNCGEILISHNGKCQYCRFPIPAAQHPYVPQAEIRNLSPGLNAHSRKAS